MTDRHSGYVVVLKEDIREDDAESILTALRMIKGVVSVEPIIGGYDLIMAQARVRNELTGKIYEALKS